MRTNPITHPIRQLFLVLAGFIVAIALLESDGLASWANHLDIGPLRTAAVPATSALQKTLAPLGIARLRQGTLLNLARIGWSDDPALLAAASAGPLPASDPDLPRTTALVVPAAPHNTFPHAAGSDAPLISALPHTTTLAPLPPIQPGKTRVVALAGDSMMAVGLSATFMRQAATDKNLRVVKAFRSGTGLSRPEVFNWMDEYPAMLGADQPDVVLVAIGANDGQGFVVDRKVLPYGSDGWRKVYQDRLASYLAMVSAGGARVVWVSLPPMRSAAYDEKIDTINHIAYSVVGQQPKAQFWNTVSLIGDDTGHYREFTTLPNGQTMRVRATDGIHLSDQGAALLTNVLIKWLDPANTDPANPDPANPVSPSPAPTNPAPTNPAPISSAPGAPANPSASPASAIAGKPPAKRRRRVHRAIAG